MSWLRPYASLPELSGLEPAGRKRAWGNARDRASDRHWLLWRADRLIDTAALVLWVNSFRWGWHPLGGMLAYLGVVLATWAGSAWLRFRLTRGMLRFELPGRCRACGYDLTGNASGRCPECGSVAKGAA